MNKEQFLTSLAERFNKTSAQIQEVFSLAIKDVSVFNPTNPEPMALRQTEARLVKEIKSFEKKISVLLLGASDGKDFNELIRKKTEKIVTTKGKAEAIALGLMNEEGTFLNNAGFAKGKPLEGKNYQQNFWGLLEQDNSFVEVRAKTPEIGLKIQANLGKVCQLSAIQATNNKALFTVREVLLAGAELEPNALYQSVSEMGKRTILIEKPTQLTGHFASENREPFFIDGLMVASANLDGAGKGAIIVSIPDSEFGILGYVDDSNKAFLRGKVKEFLPIRMIATYGSTNQENKNYICNVITAMCDPKTIPVEKQETVIGEATAEEFF